MAISYLCRYNKYERPVKIVKGGGKTVYIYMNDEFLNKIEIDELLEKLPKRYRDTAYMIYIERNRPEIVAALLGIHRATIYRRMNVIEKYMEKYANNS